MSEIENKVKECIAEIEPYRFYSADIDLAVKALKVVTNLINNLNEENRKKALEIVTGFVDRTAAYQSYIPRTTSNLKFVKEWLEEQKQEV